MFYITFTKMKSNTTPPSLSRISKVARQVIEIVMIGCLLYLALIIFSVLYSFFMMFTGEIQEISFDIPAVWITVFCLLFVLMVLRRLTK